MNGDSSSTPPVHHRYTAAEAKEVLADVWRAPDANELFAGLHGFELAFADNAEWPWMRWKHLSVDDPAYLEAIPRNLSTEAEGLPSDILRAALVVRRGVTDEREASLIKSLFTADNGLLEKSGGLGASLQLELMFLAFHERRWRAVGILASRLLQLDGVTGDIVLDQKIDDLLFDTLFFATYRPYMPGFVDDPAPLVEKLSTMQNAPAIARVLARDGIAAKVYHANILAMRGAFDEALPIYAAASDTNGFRSPVFQQAQILLPVADLTDDAWHADLAWYRERSNTEFHFPHDPAGEHAVMVAVEPGYFDLYGPLYAQIVGTTNPQALIHLHLINFPADQAQTTAAIRQMERDCNVRVNYSFEDNQLMRDRPQLKGGVCVNTRYIYLPEYLDAYASVTITDIDGWLLKSIRELSDFGDRDSLVSSWIWKKNTGYWRLPWGNLSGGYCSIKSSENSKRFARLVSHYLARLFARNAYTGKPMFYADQAAHFLCLKWAEAHWGMRVGFIGGGFAQSEELPFHDRHAGKQKAMQDKLAELQHG